MTNIFKIAERLVIADAFGPLLQLNEWMLTKQLPQTKGDMF